MKRKILALAGAFAALAAIAYCYPLRGPLLDDTASRLLSRALELDCRVSDVTFYHFQKISFGTVIARSSDREIFLARRGAISGILFSNESEMMLEDVSPGERLLPDLLSGPLKEQGIAVRELAIKKIVLISRKYGKDKYFKIKEFISPYLELRGGGQIKDGRLEKVEVLVIAGDLLEARIPGDFKKRMFMYRRNRPAIRVSFRKNVILIKGASGPVFQATWKAS